jgi:N-acetylmuramoyl-L-alanine amidase
VLVVVLLVAACAAFLNLTGSGAAGRSRSALDQLPVQLLAPWTGPRQLSVSSPDLPLGLASGACVRRDPATASGRPVIFLDPGHGGVDPGALGVTSGGQTLVEKDLTLAVALEESDRLRSDGYPVVLSRTTDSLVARLPDSDYAGGALTDDGDRRDVVARAACANAAHAAVLLSIHFDGDADPSAGGAETVYDDARPFAADNQRFAQLAQGDMVAGLHAAGWPVPDRGAIADSLVGTPSLSAQGSSYGHLLVLGPARPGYVDEPSQMPGALVEPLFITKPTEGDIAAGQTGQGVIAQGLTQAIEAFVTAPA